MILIVNFEIPRPLRDVFMYKGIVSVQIGDKTKTFTFSCNWPDNPSLTEITFFYRGNAVSDMHMGIDFSTSKPIEIFFPGDLMSLLFFFVLPAIRQAEIEFGIRQGTMIQSCIVQDEKVDGETRSIARLHGVRVEIKDKNASRRIRKDFESF